MHYNRTVKVSNVRFKAVIVDSGLHVFLESFKGAFSTSIQSFLMTLV